MCMIQITMVLIVNSLSVPTHARITDHVLAYVPVLQDANGITVPSARPQEHDGDGSPDPLGYPFESLDERRIKAMGGGERSEDAVYFRLSQEMYMVVRRKAINH